MNDTIPISSAENPRIAMPIGLIEKANPEDAGHAFNQLFDEAEKKFGEYPSFVIETKDNRILVARARK